jgi:hypothetical protein
MGTRARRSVRIREACHVLALALLPGCGAGVARVVASSGSSGGGTTPALRLRRPGPEGLAGAGDAGREHGPPGRDGADLDGDGRVDLVSANLTSDGLTVFYQDSPRSFAARPS